MRPTRCRPSDETPAPDVTAPRRLPRAALLALLAVLVVGLVGLAWWLASSTGETGDEVVAPEPSPSAPANPTDEPARPEPEPGVGAEPRAPTDDGDAPPEDAPVRWVAPQARGSGDGSSATDAAPLRQLERLVENVGPGGYVLLLADAGDYNLGRALELDAGGAEGRPVTIRGAASDGSPMAATVVGRRVDPYAPGGPKGREAFRLREGADHLHFANLAFRNVGNGCWRVAGAEVTDLTITDVTATNVRRCIEVQAGDAGGGRVTGLLVERMTVEGYSKGAIRIGGASSDVVIRDVVGDSERQGGDRFAMGLQLRGTTSGVLVERVGMHNSHDERADDKYWNGDGFVTERDVDDVRFVDTDATGHTDGGYDLKSTTTVLERPRASDNKRNYRLWSDVEVRDCVGGDPHKRGGTGEPAQVHATADADVTMTGCDFTATSAGTTVFLVTGEAQLDVGASTVETADAVRLQRVEPAAGLRLADDVTGLEDARQGGAGQGGAGQGGAGQDGANS